MKKASAQMLARPLHPSQTMVAAQDNTSCVSKYSHCSAKGCFALPAGELRVLGRHATGAYQTPLRCPMQHHHTQTCSHSMAHLKDGPTGSVLSRKLQWL